MSEQTAKHTNQLGANSEQAYDNHCPDCGHWRTETVDTRIAGFGSATTLAIVECQSCGVLFGEQRDFYGVLPE